MTYQHRGKTPLSSVASRALAVAAISCAVVLGGCGADVASQVREQSNADIAALAALDAESVAKYFSATDIQTLEDAGIDPVEFYGTLFEGVQCTVAGVDVTDNQAIAHLYVTGRDLSVVFDALRSNLAGRVATAEGRDALKDLDDSQAKAESIREFLQIAEQTPATFATTRLDIAYIRDGSTWRLADAAELGHALMGGFDAATAASSLPELQNTAEVQTETPYTSVVAEVGEDGTTTYTQ